MTSTFQLRWDATCQDCKGIIPKGSYAQYVDEVSTLMRHINICPYGRHTTGTHVINLGAVVDRRDDFPGRHRHRAIRDHAFVLHPRGEDFGCNRSEDDDENVRCGYYRKHHPTMVEH